MKAIPKIARTTQTLAIATLITYLTFFIANRFLRMHLEGFLYARDQSIEKISQQAQIEEEVKVISKVTKLYRDTKLQNQDVNNSFLEILGAVDESAKIRSMGFDRDDLLYKMVVSTRRATAFSMMINKLLKSENVTSITLNSVELSKEDNTYFAELEVNIK
jgi:hypothetical protein